MQQISKDVLLEKYAKGEESSKEEIFTRVAEASAGVEKEPEKWSPIFYQAMEAGFIPAGRIMSAAGTDIGATLINCFVQPIDDSMEGIMKSLGQAAETLRRGGGVGYDFSSIRPKDAIVKGTRSKASGPVSYMQVFHSMCKTVESAGCFRGDVLIDTTKGLVPIEQIVLSNEDYSVNTHVGPRKVIQKFNNGIKPVYKVDFEYGYSVYTTETHKFSVLDRGEIITMPLNEVRLLDRPRSLLLLNSRDHLDGDFGLSEARAYLIGAFLGNGTWKRTDDKKGVKGIAISNNVTKIDIAEKLENLLSCVGVSNPYTKKRPEENTLETFAYDTTLFTAWREAGVHKKSDLRIPEFILSSSEEDRAAFVAGIFEADGHISENKSNYRLRMASKRLLSEIQIVLSSLGVPSKLSLERKRAGTWKPLYCLGIYGSEAQDRWTKTVGTYMSKLLRNRAGRDGAGYGHPAENVLEFGYGKSKFKRFWSGNLNTHPKISWSAVNKTDCCSSLINTITAEITNIEFVGHFPVYDLEIEEVHLLSANGVYTSNSRRGAQMGVLRCDHPDILEFIHAKDKEGELTTFNISVAVTDAFMEAVKNDNDWSLVHEAEGENTPLIATKDGSERYRYKVIKARELWNEIIRSTYDHAEPGVMFIDRMNKENNLQYAETIYTSNPCLAKGSLVHTARGLVPIEHVKEGDLIHTVAGLKPLTKKECIPALPVFKVVLSDGRQVRASAGHIFHVKRSAEDFDTNTRLLDLEIGDEIRTATYVLPEGTLNFAGTETVESITFDGYSDVYDLYEEETDTWIANGIVHRGCSEQPLPAYGCCCLGSINLTKFIRRPFTANAYFQIDEFTETIKTAVRMLDNVLDLTYWPLEEQRKEAMNKRRIGLGFMGLGDALLMMNLPYDSENGREKAADIAELMCITAYRASVELAEEKGPFPLYTEEYMQSPFIRRLPKTLRDDILKYGIRNSHLLSIAPTGTISLAFGDNISNGIEPAYSWEYKRRKRISADEWQEYTVEDYAHKLHTQLSSEKRPPMPRQSDEVWKCALDISAIDHMKMVAAVQPYIDSACSKTVNVPEDYPFDDFEDLYTQAYGNGLKSLATYRPNSILGAVLSTHEESAKTNASQPEDVRLDPDRRVTLDSVPTPPLESLRWARRPLSVGGNMAWSYIVDHPNGKFAVFIGHIDTDEYDTPMPFEVWVNGEEQPRGLGALAKNLSMDMRSLDRRWLLKKLDLLRQLRGDDAYVAPYPPHGTEKRHPSLVAGFADLVTYRCVALDAFKGESTPVLDALMATHEPKAGPDGTMSWTVDIENPHTKDDFTMGVKELVLPDGTRRPFSVWLSGAYPRVLDGLCVSLSLDMRVIDPAWIGAKLRQIVDFREPLGDFMARSPGSDKQQNYPSTVAYIAALLIHRYNMLGILDKEGHPIEHMGVVKFQESKTESCVPISRVSQIPGQQFIPGRPCQECGENAVIRKDGCDFCTYCGYVGHCG